MSTDGAVIVSAFIGVPLLTLVHELGHAAAVLRFTQGRVHIQVGRADLAVKLSSGRLSIMLSPFGAGGFCRREQGCSRGQALIVALAGPAVNAVFAVLLWLAGTAASGTARPVLFTLSAVSGLYVLNLIPRRAAWNPITRGLPSDGLRALCLLRNRPLPPPPPPAGKRGGLRDPLSPGQVVWILLGAPIGVLLAAAHLDQIAWSFYLPLVLQTILAGGSILSTGSTKRASAPQIAVTPRPPSEPMKTCPECGARVRRAARLCFCDHSFD